MFGPDPQTVATLVRAIVSIAASLEALALEGRRRNDIAATSCQTTEALVREVMHRLDLPEAPDPGPTQAGRRTSGVTVPDDYITRPRAEAEAAAHQVDDAPEQEPEAPPTWQVVRIDGEGSRVLAECGSKEHATKARATLKTHLTAEERGTVQLVIREAAATHPD